MKITYSFSRWNGITTKTPYHKKPTIKELNDTRPSLRDATLKIHEREDGTRIFITDGFIEVRSSVENGIAANKYQDCYIVT